MQITINHVDIKTDRRGVHLTFNKEGAAKRLTDWLKEHGNADLRLQVNLGKDALLKIKADEESESERIRLELQPHSTRAHVATTFINKLYLHGDDDDE